MKWWVCVGLTIWKWQQPLLDFALRWATLSWIYTVLQWTGKSCIYNFCMHYFNTVIEDVICRIMRMVKLGTVSGSLPYPWRCGPCIWATAAITLTLHWDGLLECSGMYPVWLGMCVGVWAQFFALSTGHGQWWWWNNSAQRTTNVLYCGANITVFTSWQEWEGSIRFRSKLHMLYTCFGLNREVFHMCLFDSVKFIRQWQWWG